MGARVPSAPLAGSTAYEQEWHTVIVVHVIATAAVLHYSMAHSVILYSYIAHVQACTLLLHSTCNSYWYMCKVFLVFLEIKTES